MNRILSLALTAVAVTGAVALPGTASAASADCSFTRTVCLWDGTDYTGARFTVQAIDPNTGTCVDLAAHGWGNGRAESGLNTGTRTAVLYTGTNCTGTAYQLVPQGGYGSISFGSNSIRVY
ncbi:peptidase inhibitor family I36 protein [Catenuloplanes sp. NPDC051500]|uniref:peptidase inhibitor family I36 protein n=1 Tax=Catenuloplanes sp. NPDC051500 TaxID=3363959 RepID=UPI0037A7F54A